MTLHSAFVPYDRPLAFHNPLAVQFGSFLAQARKHQVVLLDEAHLLGFLYAEGKGLSAKRLFLWPGPRRRVYVDVQSSVQRQADFAAITHPLRAYACLGCEMFRQQRAGVAQSAEQLPRK